MTARAEHLTEHAKGGDRRAASEPSVPAHVLRVYIEAMHRLGYDTDAQFAEVGIRRSDLERDPDAPIAWAIWLPIMQRALQPRPLKNFLFKAAAAIPIGSFPLLDYLMVTSDSVGAAIRQLRRYLGLVGNPHVIDIEEAEDPVRVVSVSRDGRPADEFGIALTLLHLRDEAGEAFHPSYISFQHMPEDTAEIEAMFGCPVHACAAWNGFALTRSTWNLPLRRRDPILAKLLQQQRNSVVAPGQDRSPRRLQHSLTGNFRFADFVVNLYRFRRVSVRQETFAAQHAAFGNCRTNFHPRAGQRLSKRFRRGGVPHFSQSHGRGGRDLVVLIRQPAREKFNGCGVPPDADRVDDADLEFALHGWPIPWPRG